MEAAPETGATAVPVPSKRPLPLGPVAVEAYLCTQLNRYRIARSEEETHNIELHDMGHCGGVSIHLRGVPSQISSVHGYANHNKGRLHERWC